MTETVAQPHHGQTGVRAFVDRLLRRPPPQPKRPPVSFAEVVWAHHKRQEAVDKPDPGRWELVYRDRLQRFQEQHGQILDEYWCRHEASGVMLTERPGPRRWTRGLRREPILRLHAATDWRTADAPHLAAYVYRWQTAAIKASEVLRGTSERIALHRIFAGTTRVLAFADRSDADKPRSWTDITRFRTLQDAQLEEVDAYYRAAGEQQARIVYFHGMLWGTLALGLAVGGAFLAGWAVGWIDPRHEPTYALFTSVAMGAIGAILSVMTRMAKQDGFRLEFEVGRKAMRFLGGLRPWIGALFALALYLALKSQVLELLQGIEHSVYFYATVAFLAGFSERRAKVLLGGVLDGGAPAKAEEQQRVVSPSPPPAPVPR